MMCSLIFLLMRAAPNLLPAILSLIIVSCHLETQAWVNSLGVQRAYGDPLLVAEHRPVDCPGDSVLGKLERRPHIDDLVEAGYPGHLVLLQGVVRQPDSELLVVVVVPANTAICLLISVINMLFPSLQCSSLLLLFHRCSRSPRLNVSSSFSYLPASSSLPSSPP